MRETERENEGETGQRIKQRSDRRSRVRKTETDRVREKETHRDGQTNCCQS